MFIYRMTGGVISNTFSTINDNTVISSNTGGSFCVTIPRDSKGNISVPSTPVLYLGSASISNIQTNGHYLGGSMCYKSTGLTTATSSIPNYYITNFSTIATVFLPANPKDGDYIYTRNWTPLSRGVSVTISGNGKDIRRNSDNTLVASVTYTGTYFTTFHYDGTNWNEIKI
jgi:hypothetical protein